MRKLMLCLRLVQQPVRLKLMIAIKSLAVSSVALACMYLINTSVPASFSPENACYPTG